MDNGKSTALPPTFTYRPYATVIAKLNVESKSSSSLGPDTTPDFASFSPAIDRMPDNPLRNIGHRRAQSEILTFPDDIIFDDDLSIVGDEDDPSFFDDIEEDLLPFYLDMHKFNSSCDNGAFTSVADNIAIDTNRMLGVRHRHSRSMNALTTITYDMLVSTSNDISVVDSRKAMSIVKLAELALIDPKRAKRMWAIRQFAARSKKMHYISELERRVQRLQKEATSLSAQLTILKRDTQRLFAVNIGMKLIIQIVHQQIHLQSALNNGLRDEIQHLKVLTRQTMPNGGPMNFYSYGRGKQYYPNNQIVLTFLTAQLFQQLQILSHKWLYQFQEQQPQHFQQHHLQLESKQLQPHLYQPQQQQQQPEEDDEEEEE